MSLHIEVPDHDPGCENAVKALGIFTELCLRRMLRKAKRSVPSLLHFHIGNGLTFVVAPSTVISAAPAQALFAGRGWARRGQRSSQGRAGKGGRGERGRLCSDRIGVGLSHAPLHTAALCPNATRSTPFLRTFFCGCSLDRGDISRPHPILPFSPYRETAYSVTVRKRDEAEGSCF